MIALQKSDSLAIIVLADAIGLNGYSTHSLVKICMHRFRMNGTIDNVDNVQFPFFPQC